jgi:mannosyltransferase OCH1-like enzyme
MVADLYREMIIHRGWLGGSMPEKFREFGEQWRELNPELDLHDWTEEELYDVKWINQLVLDKMGRDSKKPGADLVAYYTHFMDVVDYEMLFTYGGYYFNTDLRPIKSLSTLNVNPQVPALAMEDDIHAVNMAMYAPAGDPLFKRIIENLPRRYFGAPGAFMNFSTGVHLIMQSLSEYRGEVILWPRQVFNPIHFTGFGYGEELDYDNVEVPEETVGIHGWHHRTSMRGQRILEI